MILNENKEYIYTLLISRGAILNIKFMMSFAESNLSSCTDFIMLGPCLIARHQMSSSKEENKKIVSQCLHVVTAVIFRSLQ